MDRACRVNGCTHELVAVDSNKSVRLNLSSIFGATARVVCGNTGPGHFSIKLWLAGGRLE